TVSVVACPIQGSWKPAQGGSWNDKPSYSCSTSAAGQVATDGTLTFDLNASLQSPSGVFNLALVPATNASAFTVELQPAGKDSLAVTAPPSGGAPSDESATAAPDFSSVPDTTAATPGDTGFNSVAVPSIAL